MFNLPGIAARLTDLLIKEGAHVPGTADSDKDSVDEMVDIQARPLSCPSIF